jgi:hypothetical protein
MGFVTGRTLFTRPLHVTNWNCILPPTKRSAPLLRLPPSRRNGRLNSIHSFWRTLYDGEHYINNYILLIINENINNVY